jgi:hypothetical protein
MEARRRRRRRWLAGLAVAVVASAVVAVSAVTWLPRASGKGADHSGGAGAAVTPRSARAAGHARITFRVATAGIPEGYGTEDIRFSGGSRSASFSATHLAWGPAPTQTQSGVYRIVDGQWYARFRVHGRVRWFHEPGPVYASPQIIDPRTVLRALERYTRFQVTGSQVTGGQRLTVLRATDPGRLTQRGLLPVVWTSGQHVGSLEVWADRQQVVYRMAFTFRAPGRIALSTPVSQAALRKYHQAGRAHARLEGKRVSEHRMRLAQRRLMQAAGRAYPVRQGAEVTTTTVTFSAIGQPQHIIAPPGALSFRKLVRH